MRGFGLVGAVEGVRVVVSSVIVGVKFRGGVGDWCVCWVSELSCSGVHGQCDQYSPIRLTAFKSGIEIIDFVWKRKSMALPECAPAYSLCRVIYADPSSSVWPPVCTSGLVLTRLRFQ